VGNFSVDSASLPVTQYRPTIEKYCKSAESEKLWYHIPKSVSFEIYQSYSLDYVFEGAEITQHLSPFGHICDRSIKPAQENEGEQKEQNHKNGLLHCFGIVGDNQAEAGEGQHKH